MPLMVIGLNHRTAPLEVRELWAMPKTLQEKMLSELRARSDVQAAAILSTCNRTEIYVDAAFLKPIEQWFYRASLGCPFLAHMCCYTYKDEQAVAHIFRLACGLDSMVLGETQILGQLKRSYQQSQNLKMLNAPLGKMFEMAFQVAKEVRSQTDLSRMQTSVASVAAQLALQIFGDISSARLLLIGAGEMIALCARYLIDRGVNTLEIANRTHHHAQTLAQTLGCGTALAWQDLAKGLERADIIISCTASPTHVVRFDAHRASLKKTKFMIDLALPRDIDPLLAQLEHIYVYTLDDLCAVTQEHRLLREQAAFEAEQHVRTALHRFVAWYQSYQQRWHVIQFRQRGLEVRDALLAALMQEIPPAYQDAVQTFAYKLTAHLLHEPTLMIKERLTREPEKSSHLLQQEKRTHDERQPAHEAG